MNEDDERPWNCFSSLRGYWVVHLIQLRKSLISPLPENKTEASSRGDPGHGSFTVGSALHGCRFRSGAAEIRRAAYIFTRPSLRACSPGVHCSAVMDGRSRRRASSASSLSGESIAIPGCCLPNPPFRCVNVTTTRLNVPFHGLGRAGGIGGAPCTHVRKESR